MMMFTVPPLKVHRGGCIPITVMIGIVFIVVEKEGGPLWAALQHHSIEQLIAIINVKGMRRSSTSPCTPTLLGGGVIW